MEITSTLVKFVLFLKSKYEVKVENNDFLVIEIKKTIKGGEKLEFSEFYQILDFINFLFKKTGERIIEEKRIEFDKYYNKTYKKIQIVSIFYEITVEYFVEMIVDQGHKFSNIRIFVKKL